MGTDRSKILLNSSVVSTISLVDTMTHQVVQSPQVFVGKESIFEVHWKISNLYNDISDTEATLSIPSGISWKELISAGENATWNDRTQQLKWNLGKISSGTGILSPSRELIFLISVVPQANQVNSLITILQGTEVSAKDMFTQELLKAKSDPVQVHGSL